MLVLFWKLPSATIVLFISMYPWVSASINLIGAVTPTWLATLKAEVIFIKKLTFQWIPQKACQYPPKLSRQWRVRSILTSPCVTQGDVFSAVRFNFWVRCKAKRVSHGGVKICSEKTVLSNVRVCPIDLVCSVFMLDFLIPSSRISCIQYDSRKSS